MDEAKYPTLPEDVRRFTTGEVCRLCVLQHHTLRYWTKIYAKIVSPERRSNRCYYSRADILVLRQIKELHDQGLTNAAVLERLQSSGKGGKEPALLESIAAGNRIRGQLQQVIRILE